MKDRIQRRTLSRVASHALFSIFIFLGVGIIKDYWHREPNTGDVLMRVLHGGTHSTRYDRNDACLSISGNLIGFGSSNGNIKLHHVKWLAVWADNACLLVNIDAGAFWRDQCGPALCRLNSTTDLR